MIQVGGTVAVALAYKMYEYLNTPPQAAFIAASRDVQQPALQIRLHCLANHKQDEFWNNEKTVLCASTVDELRQGETARTKIEGSFETNEEIYIKFLKNQERFSRLLILRRKQENTGTKELVIEFFYKKENKELSLLKFKIEEDKIDPKCHAPVDSLRLNYDAISTVSTTFKLSDDQKRWLVIGICMNKILLPTLRSFIKPKMSGLYSHYKTTLNIDTQVYPGHLTRDGKCNRLNYGNINSNEANHKKRADLYDYRVSSAVDLAKLYLQPFMAKFSGFDDTCDLSAALGILSSASAFSPDVQDLSSRVRKDVRNEWGHCNISVWDETKFATCFTLMDSLVKALRLTAKEEKRITDELQEWKDKGVQLCMGTITDADLVKFIELSDAVLDRLTREVRQLKNSQEDEIRRVLSMRRDFEKYKDNINKKIECLEQKVESHDRKIRDLELAIQPK